MPLEERIQKSVDSALKGMRARIEDELQSMIDQIVTAAAAVSAAPGAEKPDGLAIRQSCHSHVTAARPPASEDWAR